jgi:hypothetical protein
MRIFKVVPTKGIEPSHPCEWQILSLLRLPIPPHGQLKNQFADFKSADVIVNSLKELNLHTLENVPILNRDASTNSATWAIKKSICRFQIC